MFLAVPNFTVSVRRLKYKEVVQELAAFSLPRPALADSCLSRAANKNYNVLYSKRNFFLNLNSWYSLENGQRLCFSI